jgi:cytochrome b involved in lipid metabolism
MNVNSNSNSNSNSRTRNLVGLVACTVAFMVLSGSALTPTSWTTQTGPEYSALSIAAGYLAFDHWFSAMYCQQQQLWQVTEDALTLTVLLIVLANLGDGLGDYRTSTCAWVAYKTIRLAWQLDTDMDTPNKIMSTSVMGSPQSTTESESAPEVDMNNNDVKNSNDVNSTWIIHGETYHLQDYVTRHPGGLEAIMLGRGRDCTALFESYHPFTNQHKLVLQKYKDSGAIQQQKLSSKKMVTGKRTPTPTTPIPQDYFYEVLCQRVAQTLKQKGIDPIADRCATPLRTLYYGLVLLAVVASGISHVKVSSEVEFGARPGLASLVHLAWHMHFVVYRLMSRLLSLSLSLSHTPYSQLAAISNNREVSLVAFSLPSLVG